MLHQNMQLSTQIRELSSSAQQVKVQSSEDRNKDRGSTKLEKRVALKSFEKRKESERELQKIAV
jgi:hypothetical protein